MSTEFIPKLVTVFREGYSAKDFSRDALAGVIVGIVALPLAIAFAIASGVKPEQGLFTAVIAGFVISALGGSRVQIGGPTGAFIVLVYGIVATHGYDGLVVATIMAGALLIVMGIARLGSVIRYIPYPVTVGFTGGIAVIIGISQLGDLLGLNVRDVPAEVWGKLSVFASAAPDFNAWALLLGAATVGILMFWPRVSRSVPGPVVALVLTTAATALFGLPVETVGSRFGSVPSTLPAPHFPAIRWDMVTELFSPALAIALLAGIESLLSAVVADGMTGYRHRSNMELIAQGAANIISPLFGGIPATGAIARTATNVKTGGRTPVAGIVHAVTLLLILMTAGPLAEMIPMASLAGILLVVAFRMGEWHLFARIMKSTRSDILVLLTAFTLTVVFDLAVAIQVSVVLAALLFMKRMADVTQVRTMLDLQGDEDADEGYENVSIPEGVAVFEINGPFFFGAAHKFKTVFSAISTSPRVFIFRMRRVLSLDATGLQALEDVISKARAEGSTVLLSGVHAQPLVVMQRSGLLDTVGEENMFGSFTDALEAAQSAEKS
jgi:SulP family sulfate permease